MTTIFDLTPYTNDFVNQFDIRTEGFINFFNLMPLARGVLIKGARASVELADDMTHEKHAQISESTVTLEEVDIAELGFEATIVRASYQDIQNYGVDNAIDRKDNELFFNISDHIEDRLVTNMGEFSEASVAATNLKQGLARAAGEVRSVRGFKGSQVVAFVNTHDYYEYLADAETATAQNLFGMDYVENFLGYAQIFMSTKVPEGTVYVTARGNLNLAHVPANGPAFNALNVTPTENQLIGAKHVLDDSTGDIKTIVHFGLEAFAERVDAVVTVTLGEEVEA